MSSHVSAYGAVRLDIRGHIKYELPCRRCEFELRGQDPDGYCPGCGREIEQTIAEELNPPGAVMKQYSKPLMATIALLFMAAAFSATFLAMPSSETIYWLAIWCISGTIGITISTFVEYWESKLLVAIASSAICVSVAFAAWQLASAIIF
jgi:hypothetical protein